MRFSASVELAPNPVVLDKIPPLSARARRLFDAYAAISRHDFSAFVTDENPHPAEPDNNAVRRRYGMNGVQLETAREDLVAASLIRYFPGRRYGRVVVITTPAAKGAKGAKRLSIYRGLGTRLTLNKIAPFVPLSTGPSPDTAKPSESVDDYLATPLFDNPALLRPEGASRAASPPSSRQEVIMDVDDLVAASDAAALRAGMMESELESQITRMVLTRRHERLQRAKQHASRAPSSDDSQKADWLLSMFYELYEEKVGAAYPLLKGDRQHIVRLLKTYSVEQLAAYLDFFLGNYDPQGSNREWVNSVGLSVRVFVRQFAAVVQQASREDALPRIVAAYQARWEEQHNG